MKSKGHIYMANVMLECLKSPEEQVFFPNASKHGKYGISPYISQCITDNASYFRAGAVGPDFFPDLIFGQMRIHATYSGRWIERMMEELRLMPPNTREQQQAIAFYCGYMMHYAGDMFTHDYINGYAKGWFPSYSEVFHNLFSYDTDVEKVKKTLPELLEILKRMFSSEKEKKRLKKNFSELAESLEKLLSIEAEKEELARKYRNLTEALKKLFSAEKEEKELKAVFQELHDFLGLLKDDPLSAQQLGEEYPRIREAFEQLSYNKKKSELKQRFPETEKAISDFLTFDTEKERLEKEYPKMLECLDDIFSVDELREQFRKEFPELEKVLKKQFMDQLWERRKLGVEQAKRIIRHILVEKYMDDYIDKQADSAHLTENRTLDIPVDYLKRCFASGAAVEELKRITARIQKREGQLNQKEEGNKGEPNQTDAGTAPGIFGSLLSYLDGKVNLERLKNPDFLMYYMEYCQKLYSSGGTTTLNIRESTEYIDTWIGLWEKIAEYALEKGTFKALDLYMKEIFFHVLAAVMDKEEERRKWMDRLEGLDTFLGVIDVDIPILSNLSAMFKRAIKKCVQPIIFKRIKNDAAAISGRKVEDLNDYDEAVEAVKRIFKNAEYLLYNKKLFPEYLPGGEKEPENPPEHLVWNPVREIIGEIDGKEIEMQGGGLPARLCKEWGNLGATYRLKDIDFDAFQDACRMGYLCLMEPERLNELMRSYDSEFGTSKDADYNRSWDEFSDEAFYDWNARAAFKNTPVSAGISRFSLLLRYKNGGNIRDISKIRLIVNGEGGYKDILMHAVVDFRGEKGDETGAVRLDIPCDRTVPLDAIRTFRLILNPSATEGFEEALSEKPADFPLLCFIYDASTNMELAHVNMQRTSEETPILEEVLHGGDEDIAHMEKFQELNVEIKTGDDGTDGDVHFVIVHTNGARFDVILDKEGYNDFEQNDHDTYLVRLDHPRSIDEISHFELYKNGGGSWKAEFIRVFSTKSGDCFADSRLDREIGEERVRIPKTEKWVADTSGIGHAPVRPSEDLVKGVVVTVKTADELYAGTDNDLYFTTEYYIYNNQVEKDERCLDTAGHNDFERNDIDTFEIYFKTPIEKEDLKRFTLTKVGKDDWVCDWIKVYDIETKIQLGSVDGPWSLGSEEEIIFISVD